MKGVDKVAWIPPSDFKGIHARMPLACVDVVVRLAGRPEVLLVRRTVDPMRGKWWFPGGRVWRGERLVDAARRVVTTEVSFPLKGLRILGADETMFAEDPFGHGYGTHTVNVVFAAMTTMAKAVIDDYHSAYRWVRPSRIREPYHPYVARWAAEAVR